MKKRNRQPTDTTAARGGVWRKLGVVPTMVSALAAILAASLYCAELRRVNEREALQQISEARELLAVAGEGIFLDRTSRDCTPSAERQEELEEAREALRRAEQMKALQAERVYYLGVYHALLCEYEEATAFMEEAIEREEENSKYHHGLGAVLIARGDNTKAIAELSKATRLEPENAYAFNNLGVAKRAEGDLSGSRTAFEEAVRLKPAKVGFLENLAVTLHQMGDFAGAIENYRKIHRARPADEVNLFNLAEGLRQKATGATATELLDPCSVPRLNVRIDSKDVEIAKAIKIYGQLKERELFIRQEGPNLLALALSARGDYQEALHVIEEYSQRLEEEVQLFLEEDTKDRDMRRMRIHLTSAIVLTRMGNAEMATHELDVANRIAPGDCQVENVLRQISGSDSD